MSGWVWVGVRGWVQWRWVGGWVGSGRADRVGAAVRQWRAVSAGVVPSAVRTRIHAPCRGVLLAGLMVKGGQVCLGPVRQAGGSCCSWPGNPVAGLVRPPLALLSTPPLQPAGEAAGAQRAVRGPRVPEPDGAPGFGPHAHPAGRHLRTTGHALVASEWSCTPLPWRTPP